MHRGRAGVCGPASLAKPYIDQYLPHDPFHTLVVDYTPVGPWERLSKTFSWWPTTCWWRGWRSGPFRVAEAVLPPHAADGRGHVRRGRHGRPDEPLHQRHEQGGRRAGIAVRQTGPRADEDVACLGGAATLLAAAAADHDRHPAAACLIRWLARRLKRPIAGRWRRWPRSIARSKRPSAASRS